MWCHVAYTFAQVTVDDDAMRRTMDATAFDTFKSFNRHAAGSYGCASRLTASQDGVSAGIGYGEISCHADL